MHTPAPPCPPPRAHRAGHTGLGLLIILSTASLQAQPTAGQLVWLQHDEPRAYGHLPGDRLQRLATAQVPAGLVLDAGSLPQAGKRGQALELQQAQWQPLGDGRWRLRLDYQVFLSPTAVRTLELAPIVLRFTGQPRAQELRLDAWPVTVSPLVPVEVSPRRGLGELQPDDAPPLLDTGPTRQRLGLWLAGATLLAAWLAVLTLGLPWWGRRQRPFQQAWRGLRSALAGTGSTGGAAAQTEQLRSAWRLLHAALNQTAGAVLFEAGLDGFLARHPRYAPLRAELQQFFQHSRSLFFADAPGPAPGPAPDLAWLRTLARRCRDIERGTA